MIRTRCAALCLAALLTLSTHPGEPETSGMPAQVEQKLREMGRVIDPAATARLYGPLHEKEPYAGVKIARDIRYGKGPPGSFYFDNVGIFSVRGGWIGVNVTYRLAPKYTCCRANKCPRLARLARHSHMSEVYSINTADMELANRIAEFLNATR